MPEFRGTTILSVRRGDQVVIGGDGQVSLGNTVMKGNACKVRRLYKGDVIAGFAGSTADAFTLFELFDAKLAKHQGILTKAALIECYANSKLCFALRIKRLPMLFLAMVTLFNQKAESWQLARAAPSLNQPHEP